MTPGQLALWFHERGYAFTAQFDSDQRFRIHANKGDAVDIVVYAKQGDDPDAFVQRVVNAVAALTPEAGEGART